MPEVGFSVDQSKSMADQAVPGHNRWHPDIPPAASVPQMWPALTRPMPVVNAADVAKRAHSRPADIEGGAQHGVDERQRIGPGIHRSPRNFYNVGDIRRKLAKERKVGNFPDRMDDFISESGVHAETAAAGGDVGTRDIDLQSGRLARVIQPASDFHELLYRLARDIHNNRNILVLQELEFLGDHSIHTRILKPNAVQHSGWSLVNAWWRIPLPGVQSGRADARPVNLKQDGALSVHTRRLPRASDKVPVPS